MVASHSTPHTPSLQYILFMCKPTPADFVLTPSSDINFNTLLLTLFSLFRTEGKLPMEECKESLWLPLHQVRGAKRLGKFLQVITLIFPVRHDPPCGVNPVDIHGFQPPWKSLTDFALHQEMDRMDPNSPQFQHLVGQVIIGACYEKHH